jgi:hypothetical protein
MSYGEMMRLFLVNAFKPVVYFLFLNQISVHF